MIKPKKLLTGDTVAIIAPASPASQDQIDSVKGNLLKLGLNYKMLPSCTSVHGHFAGSDQLRANDIHEAFLKYDGIICLKGGYGTPRLLPLLDYNLIKNNPKVFVGYSDITGLHMAINKLSNIVTFHGPMASSTFEDDYTLTSLKNAIMHGHAGEFNNPLGETLNVLVDGQAEGTIIGGNLSLIVSTLGSPYEIDTKDKILFIEEVHEATYKVDRMLTSLMLAGKFEDCSGIILGTFSNCEPEVIIGKKTDLDLSTIFSELILPYNKPTISNFRAGHNYPQATIPFGTKVRIESNKIKFLEGGVI